MRLVLTQDNWWQEVGDAAISALTKEKLRGAINGCLHRVSPPVITSNEFRFVRKQVSSLKIDGIEAVMERDGFRLRLAAKDQHEVVAMLHETYNLPCLVCRTCGVEKIFLPTISSSSHEREREKFLKRHRCFPADVVFADNLYVFGIFD